MPKFSLLSISAIRGLSRFCPKFSRPGQARFVASSSRPGMINIETIGRFSRSPFGRI